MIEKYPYTDFNEYNLDWVIVRIKELTEEWVKFHSDLSQEWSEENATLSELVTQLNDLKDYITNYFNNLDVQEEINHKIDEMAEDGSLLAIMQSTIETQTATTTTAWLNEHIRQETGYVIDDTLTVSGAAADAKVVGERIGILQDDIGKLIEIPFEIEGNGYVEFDSGNILSTDNYRYSEPIQLLKGVKYTLTSVNYTAVAAFALCDEDGTNIRPIIHGLYDGEGVYTTVDYTPVIGDSPSQSVIKLIPSE